jgi:hypothetical protein
MGLPHQPEPQHDIGLGKKVTEKVKDPPEWIHTPTPQAPDLWTNRKTGRMENRSPGMPFCFDCGSMPVYYSGFKWLCYHCWIAQ